MKDLTVTIIHTKRIWVKPFCYLCEIFERITKIKTFDFCSNIVINKCISFSL